MRVIGLLLGSVLLSGCAGVVALEIESTPEGAKVYVHGEQIGTTPTGVIFYRTSEERIPITLELLNHKPVQVLLRVNPRGSEAEAKQKPHKLNWNLRPRRR